MELTLKQMNELVQAMSFKKYSGIEALMINGARVSLLHAPVRFLLTPTQIKKEGGK